MWLTCKAANHSLFCFCNAMYADLFGSLVLQKRHQNKKANCDILSHKSEFFSDFFSIKKIIVFRYKYTYKYKRRRDIFFNYLFIFYFVVETKNRIERCKLWIVRKKVWIDSYFPQKCKGWIVINKLRIERKSEFGDKKINDLYFILWWKPQNKNVNLY